MYAVICTGGKQYPVRKGQRLMIEKLPLSVGESVKFDQVLMIADNDNVRVGSPTVAGSRVEATVVNQTRGEKIRIIKHRRRKHHHKEMGHRQWLTEVEIKEIHI